MKQANPSIQTLKDLIALEERRALIQGELNTIEQKISTLQDSIVTGSPVSASAPQAKVIHRPATGKGPLNGGTYREYILAALEAAGDAGLRVKEIAASLKTKPVNIHSWFHSNLKKFPSIKKITGGHYKFASGAHTSVAAPKSAPAAKPAKGRKGAKRGALSASIIEHLKAAGSGGIKISDLAEKVGAKYKNVYIWFATTGKKNPGIRRIAPATYQLKS